jgi:glycosyltransferase involved in cell wall biosynthesis
MVRVSVVIPVFNGAATVARAIDSALAQHFAGEFEVIVVNDGSTDSTAAVLDTYRGQINVVDQNNSGLAAARNAAIGVAKGEYIALLDADDIWMPGKLEAMSAVLDRMPAVVLVYSDAIPVDDADAALAGSFVGAEFAHAPSMEELLSRWWPILPSAAVMRREAVEACGGFCEEFRRAYEDVYFWLLMRERGEFAYVAKPLLRYRTTPIVERMERYEFDYKSFERRVHERYGARARGLVRRTRAAYVSALGYRGLVAMNRGDTAASRRYLARALRYQPLHLKTGLRLLRTFLPAPIARALTGRTRDLSADQRG